MCVLGCVSVCPYDCRKVPASMNSIFFWWWDFRYCLFFCFRPVCTVWIPYNDSVFLSQLEIRVPFSSETKTVTERWFEFSVSSGKLLATEKHQLVTTNQMTQNHLLGHLTFSLLYTRPLAKDRMVKESQNRNLRWPWSPLAYLPRTRKPTKQEHKVRLFFKKTALPLPQHFKIYFLEPLPSSLVFQFSH